MIAEEETGGQSYSRPLEGSEKVAILLLALDRSLASQLLHHFEEDEISIIRSAADSLEPITAADLEVIVEEFAGQVSAGMNFIGTPGEVHNLLNTVLSEPEEEEGDYPTFEFAEAEMELPPVWLQLEQLPLEEILMPFLLGEHPQTVTLILSSPGSTGA